jgi:DNA-binding transcriptional regulator LsrR (DeoR family)
LSVVEIARRFGANRSSVTRWLAEAERDEWLDRRPRLLLSPKQLLEISLEAHDAHKEARLLKRLRTPDSPLRKVLVAPIIPPLDAKANQDETALADVLRETTGRAAALYINSLVEAAPQRARFGISWGQSLAKMIDALELIAKPNPLVTCLPLVGSVEVVLTADQRANLVAGESNILAQRLCYAYGAPPPQLLTIPAYLPRDARDRPLAVLRDYFENSPSYRYVFGRPDRPGHVWETRIAIVGIGSIQTTSWPAATRYISAKDLTRLEKAGAIGDIAAKFYGADGLHEPDCACLLCRTNVRVLGIRLRTLAALARNLGPDGKPDHRYPRRHVIGIASGRKAKAIIGAARMLLTDLVVDESTADEMLAMLEAERTSAPPASPGNTRAGRA